MTFLDEAHDVVSAAKGLQAPIVTADNGIGAIVLGQWIMLLPQACRLRNAGYIAPGKPT